jgi:hypothetical protein
MVFVGPRMRGGAFESPRFEGGLNLFLSELVLVLVLVLALAHRIATRIASERESLSLECRKCKSIHEIQYRLALSLSLSLLRAPTPPGAPSSLPQTRA